MSHEADSAGSSATATAAENTDALSQLAQSLSLSAEAWDAITSVGACACCAARLAGCHNPTAYNCDEPDLRAHLDARFELKKAACSMAPAAANGDGDDMVTKPCTLCLGLLQPEVPLLLAPPARPSAESRGPDERACLLPLSSPTNAEFSHSHPSATDEKDDPSTKPKAIKVQRDVEHSSGEGTETQSRPTTADMAAAVMAGAGVPPPATKPESADPPQAAGFVAAAARRPARIAESIARCSASRGYTVSTFAITAAVPACLAVRDAAFVFALGNLLKPASSGTTHSTTPPHGRHHETTGTTSVKDAMKYAVVGALEAQFEVPYDNNADFIVDITAKAPAADAHAAGLLGSPPPAQSGGKPVGWPGSGRWAKKRQRREEHRFPGLTVGAVKKALDTLTEEGKERMRQWVEGLRKGAAEAVADGKRDLAQKAAAGGERRAVNGNNEGDGIPGVVNGTSNLSNGHGKDSKPGLVLSSEGALPFAVEKSGTAGINGSAVVHLDTAAVPAGNDSKVAAVNTAALCDVVIRRQPLHFWGRYTKLSRSVPQTPWIRGYFSVQEAVSEPFEALSGCVETFLHGAGREDVDVRMLGNGRPFSLELVDSRRSLDEIAAQLPALQDAVNSGAGRKNAGGAVSISKLRVAAPGDLPSEVQKVGEGKRKHYRCVVWVSKRVGRDELKHTLCGWPELVIQQSTPLRVLHRRTLMNRPKSIFNMSVEWINDHFFRLDLTTSAGTYVKEFVHGDLGRTVPSVGSLLNCRADILQLDVTAVEDKWSVAEE